MKQKNLGRRLPALILALLLPLSALAVPAGAVSTGAEASEEAAQSAQSAETTEAAETTESTETTEAQTETISISTAQELVELAENCRTDTWSQNKVVVLENDISLEGVAFSPIATFGGTFRGNGHTISGLELTAAETPAGLFSQVQRGGVIQKLTVSGTVSPEGSGQYVGGIAGQNSGTIKNCTFIGLVEGNISTGGIAGDNAAGGQILSCTASGAVFGSSMTGGICGSNAGTVENCTNQAAINNESVDPSLSLEDISLDLNLDLEHLSTSISALAQNNAPVDAGGVAGYSSGIVTRCTNDAVVGYPHIGYNVGGVIGRSCGYVRSCQNTGTVNGRKDIGGIVGQTEPFTLTILSESTVKALEQQLEELDAMVEQTRGDAGALSDITDNRLTSMGSYADSAIDAVNNLRPSASVTGSASAGGNVSTTGSGSAGASASGELSGSGSSDTQADGAAQGAAGSAGGIVSGQNGSGGIVLTPGGAAAGSSGSQGVVGGTISGGAGEVSGSVSTQVSGETAGSGESTAGVSGQVDSTGSVTASGSAYVSVNLDTSGITAALNGMNSQMEALQEELAGQSDLIDEDLDQMSGLLEEVQDTLLEAADPENLKDLVTDASDSDLSAITFGKVYRCENTAAVSGDLNVGGITGALSQETSVDPEDDLTQELDEETKTEYELKAVLQSCTNTGTVTARRSYVGGIVGRMDLGLTTDCGSYGPVESESGDYAGGIAGLNRSVIRGCFAKTTIKGGSFVGGITGSGIDAGADGTGSLVEGCMSMVELPEAEEFSGAISGSEAGSYSENYFVSDTLAGLNLASYTGQAEPMGYEKLTELEELPEAFETLTVRFVAEDVILKEVSFSYGDSLEDSVYPDIPEKEGYYGRWDITDLSDLCFDTTVTVVYTPYTTVLTSDAVREDDRAVFLLQGSFTRSEAMEVQEAAVSVTTDTLGIGKEAQLFGKEVTEQWTLTLPTEAEEETTLRYLAPEGKAEDYTVYVRSGSSWQKAQTEAVGSYLLIPVSGSRTELAVVSEGSLLWLAPYGGIGAGVLGLLLLLILLLRRHRKKRAAAAEQTQQTEQTEQQPPAGRKKRRHRVLVVLLLILLLLAGGITALVLLRPDLKDKAETIVYLTELNRQEELDLSLEVSAQADGSIYSLSCDLWQTTREGEKITCISRDGLSLYYADGAVFLEDGTAYAVGDSYPDVSQLLQLAETCFASPELTTGAEEGYETYTVTLEPEDTQRVLELLCPQGDWAETSAGITLRLYCADSRVDRMTLSASGAVKLDAELEVLWDKKEKHTVPEAVLTAIDDGSRTDASPITQDVYRLLAAWAQTDARDPLGAEIELSADCGPVTVSDSVSWARTRVQGEDVHRLTIAGQDIYLTGQSLCGATGSTVTDAEEKTAQCLKLLEIAYDAFRQGGMGCTEEDGIYTYTLALTQEQMQQAALAIAPELEERDISLSDGYFEAVVEDDTLSELHFRCGGSVTVLKAKLTASLEAEVRISQETEAFTVPERVRETLLGKD